MKEFPEPNNTHASIRTSLTHTPLYLRSQNGREANRQQPRELQWKKSKTGREVDERVSRIKEGLKETHIFFLREKSFTLRHSSSSFNEQLVKKTDSPLQP